MTRRNQLRLFFLEMLGEPGSYDASVYDHLPDNDHEGLWFKRRFAKALDVDITVRRLPHGDSLPDPRSADAFILGGSYNSVHDRYPWQQDVLDWLPLARESTVPVLGICGAHQLLGVHFGERVIPVANPPCAGTQPVALTGEGEASALFAGIPSNARFHFANNEQVAAIPKDATLLATNTQVPVAALDYGGHWYSTQYHPESSAECLACSWRKSHPAISETYFDDDAGQQLIANFISIARSVTE